MENNFGADLGPRPTGVAPSARLSVARRELLDLLAEQREPIPLATLVELSGRHENTVRGHLAGLAADGLVLREREAPSGRGRPAWLWRVSPAESDEYAGLAAALAKTLRRTSARPEDDAVEAGEAWGRELASQRPVRGGSPVRRVRELLERLGFGPEGDTGVAAEAARLRLTRCPLLEAATEEPAVVCNVHLGLVAGALDVYGAVDPDAELVPFAEPGACLLTVRAAS